jgi:hypothetical protein
MDVRRLSWYLAGWLALSGLALVAVFLIKRPVHSEPVSQIAPRPIPAPSGEQLTAGGSPGWRLHLFYTAVEKYHHGAPAEISGCFSMSCTVNRALGAYPADFLAAVRAQGSGLISYGKFARHFLNWSESLGYRLDTSPRANGLALRRFHTVESGSPQLSAGTSFRIVACGSGSACARLRTVKWTVAEVVASRPDRDLWFYVGLETGPGGAPPPNGAVLRIC